MSSKDSKKTPTNLNYLFQNTQKSVKDGKVDVLEEMVVDGPRGLKINFYKKSDNSVEKIVIYGKDDSFKLRTADGEKTLSKTELLDELKSNKKLKFALEFAKSQKGGKINAVCGGSKKSSKKTSKKSSKKSSKKTSKKSSKNQLKGGKKASKKTSKKTSKKPSKKPSKKTSKKPSKKSSKTLMKGGKKASKKTSKKPSKKSSKKPSKKTSKK